MKRRQCTLFCGHKNPDLRKEINNMVGHTSKQVTLEVRLIWQRIYPDFFRATGIDIEARWQRYNGKISKLAIVEDLGKLNDLFIVTKNVCENLLISHTQTKPNP
jgi:hypothetical protein